MGSTSKLKVLDLFSGLGGWSEPFKTGGHDVLTLDNEPKFKPDILADILEWDPDSLPWTPDLILASPPCQLFSTAGWHRKAWKMEDKRYWPIKEEAWTAARIVARTVYIIEHLQPKNFVIENPRGLLRKLDLIPYPRTTVWYCHLGELRAKPTDLWGRFPEGLVLPEECHNQRPGHPADCCCQDHAAAPRGSVTGTQGMSTAQAGKIPFALAHRFCWAASHV